LKQHAAGISAAANLDKWKWALKLEESKIS
jgi:hypothetical protein